MEKIRIGNTLIGNGEPCFIVAEAGVNHDGDINLAKKLIDAAKEAGADAVKFQTWKTENMILKDVEMAEYQKENISYKESQYEMLKKLELPYAGHFELKKYADRLGLVFFSTMEDKESIDFLIKNLKIPLIKVGSGDLTNYPLLKYTARFKKPMVLSTGMATLSEVDEAVRTVLNEGNDNIILLQCTTQYPCTYEDINLRAMLGLKETFKTIVGFSDHSLGVECAVAAIALGAKYIEKHFTLDRNLSGPDHKASLEPEEFKRMVDAIRNTEKALGDGIKKPMPSELKNKKITVRKIVASKGIKKGEPLNEDNITFKRAKYGLDARYYIFVDGKRAKKDISKDDAITFDFIEG
uniref:AFP-like domain-containing protein n=1 Tax=Candidatus Methanogaster sp. ANME-2c ERB4 TaxID=2759911 RepID=A0A7G9YLD6_9EURY|nr:hypothetical protein IMBEDNDK_00030 [Methanosarcinales archaeon ANME-2c ERB4]